jgi:hypothetical protein
MPSFAGRSQVRLPASGPVYQVRGINPSRCDRSNGFVPFALPDTLRAIPKITLYPRLKHVLSLPKGRGHLYPTQRVGSQE